MTNAQHIKDTVAKHAPRAIELRRIIHQNPELSELEYKTCELVCAHLTELGIEHERLPDSTAVVGIIRGIKPGKTVALRADMDALPIEENCDLPYISKCPGVMHACGHDVHTAVLLGAASVLQEMKSEFSGNVKLLFQPAEEGNGGAKGMIAAGCMDNPTVDFVYGLHCDGSVPEGSVACKIGPINASSDTLTITVYGQKAHGAAPHRGVDAIFVASQIVTALHGLPSRRIAPIEPFAINVGTFHGGEVHNVICDRVEMHVMLRTLSSETRTEVKKQIADIVQGICTAHGARGDLHIHESYKTQVNDEKRVSRVAEMAQRVLGDGCFVKREHPTLGTEDFCYFGDCAPSAFYYLGTVPAPGHERASAHSSEYTVDDEKAIPTGMAMQVALALDALL